MIPIALPLSVEIQKFIKNWIHTEQRSLNTKSGLATFLAHGGNRRLVDLCDTICSEVEDQLAEFRITRRYRQLKSVLALVCTLGRELGNQRSQVFAEPMAGHDVVALTLRDLFENKWKYSPRFEMAAEGFGNAIRGWLLKAHNAELAFDRVHGQLDPGAPASAEAVLELRRKLVTRLNEDALRIIRQHWILPPNQRTWGDYLQELCGDIWHLVRGWAGRA